MIPRIIKELGLCVYWLTAYEPINENLIRQIAVAFHNDYCKKRFLDGQTVETNENLVLFDKLSPHFQEANFDSARTIPRKLKLLGIEIHKAMTGTEPEILELKEDEIEKLLRWEHTRWNWQKILDGWIFGIKKDEALKTHPCILPWELIAYEIQDYDRQNIRLIPEIIKEAVYEAVRR